jgi:hypothetical protein
MHMSAANTCCAKASKARDKIVTMAPKEAKYLLIISKRRHLTQDTHKKVLPKFGSIK